MKLSTLCLLAVTVWMAGWAPVRAEAPKGKAPARTQAAPKDPDQATINSYLKALQDKYGYAFTLKDTAAVKAAGTTPAKPGSTTLTIKAATGVGTQLPIPNGSLSVDMTGVKTEADVEGKIVKALIGAKVLEENDTAGKVPVFYRAKGGDDIFKGAVAPAVAATGATAPKDDPLKKDNDYKFAMDLKQGRLAGTADGAGIIDFGGSAGRAASAVVIRVGGEKNVLVATRAYDDLSFQRATTNANGSFHADTQTGPDSIYYKFNEVLKKRAKAAGGPDATIDTEGMAKLSKSIGEASAARLDALYDKNSAADATWAASPEGQAVLAAKTQAHQNPGTIAHVGNQYEYRYQSLDGITHVVPIGQTLPKPTDPSIQAVSNTVAKDLIAGNTGSAKAKALMDAFVPGSTKTDSPSLDLPPGKLTGVGPDGKPLPTAVGPDGKPLPTAVGPDGKPLPVIPDSKTALPVAANLVGPGAATGLESGCGKGQTLADYKAKQAEKLRAQDADQSAERQQVEQDYAQKLQDAQTDLDSKVGGPQKDFENDAQYKTRLDRFPAAEQAFKAANERADAWYKDQLAKLKSKEAQAAALKGNLAKSDKEADAKLRTQIHDRVEVLRKRFGDDDAAMAKQYVSPDSLADQLDAQTVKEYFDAYWPLTSAGAATYKANLEACANGQVRVNNGHDTEDCVGRMLGNYIQDRVANAHKGGGAQPPPSRKAALELAQWCSEQTPPLTGAACTQAAHDKATGSN